MFDRENWVGVMLLAVCGVGGGILLWTIATRATLTYDGPAWLPPVLLVVYIGALIFAFVRRPKTWL